MEPASPFERPNVAATFSALRDAGPRTLTELTHATGLSRPTVEDALTRLIDVRVVEDLAPDGGGKVGRPARLYRFRPEAGTLLGLDIGEHRVAAMLTDLTGAPLATVAAQVSAGDSGDDRLAAVRGVIRKALSKAGRTRADLWAAAAGTAGIVDRDGKVVISEILPDWTGRNLAGDLRRSLVCPIRVENDANLAALAEHWRGAAVGVDDVVYLYASHRLGAGLLIGGRVHRGFAGAAGEIGSFRLLHWESAARRLSQLDHPVPEDELDRVADEIYAAARAGDAAAMATVVEFANDLAASMAAIASAVDPELVVLGGRSSRAGDLLVPLIERRLSALCLIPPRVAVSTLDESIVLGAVRTAMDIVNTEVFKQ